MTQIKDTLVAFVYCRYTEALSIRDILASLARQILEDHDHLAPLLEPLYERCTLRDMSPTQPELLALLSAFSNSFPSAHYILDGLDEAPTDIQFQLVEVLASLGGNLLVTSRPLPFLMDVVPGAAFFDIVADDVDIKHLVSQKVE